MDYRVRTGFRYVFPGKVKKMLIFLAAEEICKYQIIKKKVEVDETASPEIREMQYLDLSRYLFTAMALSLGYGTYQGIAASAFLSKESTNLLLPLIISLIVAALYIPSHVMTGYLIALQLGRRVVLNETIPSLVIVLWPVLFRTTFLFQFLFWAMESSHPLAGWILTSLALTVGFCIYIRYVKKKLPREYLDSAGYNAVLGYIPIVDDAA
jgi:hypothetical protein